MALFDIFKKKKKEVKKKPASAPKGLRRGEERKKEAKEVVKERPIAPAKPKKVSVAAYRILKWPHVTEKATDLTNANQYVFNVYKGANKTEIKKTVEDVYGVKVIAVRIIKIPRKQRRLGRIQGWRQGYKKAIIRLAEGQKIEILPR